MDPIQKTTALIFAVTVVLIVTRKFSTVGFSLLGVIAMVVAGVMTDVEAFKFVDVHLLVILVSVWIIAEYFGKTGIPEYLGDLSLRLSRGNIPLFVTLVGVIAGFISMFVNNVVVVLMLAPVIDPLHRPLFELHGDGASPRGSPSPDASQRDRHRVLRLYLAFRTALVVSDPDRGLPDRLFPLLSGVPENRTIPLRSR
jgi:hypothetical protein